jgi:hypothetical protein
MKKILCLLICVLPAILLAIDMPPRLPYMDQTRINWLSREVSDKYHSVNEFLSYGQMSSGETRKFPFELKGRNNNLILVIPSTIPVGRTLKVTFDTGFAFKTEVWQKWGDQGYLIYTSAKKGILEITVTDNNPNKGNVYIIGGACSD